MSFTTPNYLGINIDADEGPLLKTASIAFISLTVYTIAIRCFSRWYTKIPLGLDDLFILIAATLSIAYTAVIIVEVQTNFYGQHIGKSDLKHLESYLKGLYSLSIIYPIALSMSKLSLLALYWRVFAVTGGRIPILVTSAVNGAWGVAALLVGIFSCHPIEAFWHITTTGECIDYQVFFTSNEAFTIVLDIVVLFIPVWFIAQIKRSVGERMSISMTFLLGFAVTVVSAIRLWRLVVAQRMPGFDPIFNEVDAGLWAIIELNLWVLVASIPTLRPLFGKIWRDHFEKKTSGGSGDCDSSDCPSRKTRTSGTTFFQKQQRDMDLDLHSDTDPVYEYAMKCCQGSVASEIDIERFGSNGSSGTGIGGDSGFDDGLGITLVDVYLDMDGETEGARNVYGHACQRGSSGNLEKDRSSNEGKDLVEIKVQKERVARRQAGVWAI